MYAYLKNLHIYEDTCSRENESKPIEGSIIFKKGVTDCFETIKQLTSVDPKELTTQEFYDLLSKAYNMALTEDDYLKMLSLKNGKRYTKVSDIKTTIVRRDVVGRRDGNGFSWSPTPNQIIYSVAQIDELKFNKDFDYTKEEIKRLVTSKDIVILSESTQELTTIPSFRKEFYEKLPQIDVHFYPFRENMSAFVKSNFFLLDGILKSTFPKKRLLEDMKTFLIALNYEIDLVNRCSYEELKSECMKWFAASKEKEDITSLTKSFAASK